MTTNLTINGDRLWSTIMASAEIGKGPRGGLRRLTLSDDDKHALEATGGKTYSELSQDDPLRQTAMSASFLRASLFTSVVAFGVALMAAGLGVTLILIALALLSVAKASVRETVPAG